MVKSKKMADLFVVKVSKWKRVKVTLLVNKITLLNNGTLLGLNLYQDSNQLNPISGFGQKSFLNINQKNLKNNITSLKTNNKKLYLKQSKFRVVCWPVLVSKEMSVIQYIKEIIRKIESIYLKGENPQTNHKITPIKFIKKQKQNSIGLRFGKTKWVWFLDNIFYFNLLNFYIFFIFYLIFLLSFSVIILKFILKTPQFFRLWAQNWGWNNSYFLDYMLEIFSHLTFINKALGWNLLFQKRASLMMICLIISIILIFLL